MNEREEMNIPENLFDPEYSASQLIQDTQDTIVVAKVGLFYFSLD